MKAIHLKFISASCLAAACMLIVSRQAGLPALRTTQEIKHRSDGERSRIPRMGDSGTTTEVPGLEPPSHQRAGQHAEQEAGVLSVSEATSETAGAQDSRPTTQTGPNQTNHDHGDAAGISQTYPSAGNNPRGIRLASNVQLPAVSMALGNPQMTDPAHIPTPVEQAARNIESKFYQDLLQATGEPAENTEGTGEEATTVITPGREVDAARAKANEMYRAIFGDAAYNRRGMNSVIEVHLPETPAE